MATPDKQATLSITATHLGPAYKIALNKPLVRGHPSTNGADLAPFTVQALILLGKALSNYITLL
jgi:hypothetical protein